MALKRFSFNKTHVKTIRISLLRGGRENSKIRERGRNGYRRRFREEWKDLTQSVTRLRRGRVF
jgi:hypothetical protein